MSKDLEQAQVPEPDIEELPKEESLKSEMDSRHEGPQKPKPRPKSRRRKMMDMIWSKLDWDQSEDTSTEEPMEITKEMWKSDQKFGVMKLEQLQETRDRYELAAETENLPIFVNKYETGVCYLKSYTSKMRKVDKELMDDVLADIHKKDPEEAQLASEEEIQADEEED